MTGPRLFPDYAAAPTAAERRAARAEHEAMQRSLFDMAAPAPEVCPVCAGGHSEDECGHGAAPRIMFDEVEDRDDEHEPEPEPEPEPEHDEVEDRDDEPAGIAQVPAVWRCHR